jgi:hypothetical protein
MAMKSKFAFCLCVFGFLIVHSSYIYCESLFKFSNYFYKFKFNNTNNNTNNNNQTSIGRIPFYFSSDSILNKNEIDFSLIDSVTNLTTDLFYIELVKQGMIDIRLSKNYNNTLSNAKNYLRLYAIKRRDGKKLAHCYVIIYANNGSEFRAPVFKQDMYEAQIYEKNAPDTLVLRVEAANDQFNTDSNSHISYQLLNIKTKSQKTEPNNLFQIKSDTGEIYAKRTLNCEQRDSYTLEVLAVDNRNRKLSTKTRVSIRVLEQNELLRPKIESKVFNISISEITDFTQKPAIFKLNATDLNPHSNHSLLYYSLHGTLNDLNTFEIDETTGIIRLVSKLSYELKQLYTLNIFIRDASIPSSSSHILLNIIIENTNFQPPLFQASFYEFILFENSATLNQKVGRVSALYSPRSSAKNKKIVYSLNSILNKDLTTNSRFPFRIDPSNGTIYVNENHLASRQNYEFYVSAFNSLALNKTGHRFGEISSNVKVKIRILDLNDNVPEFDQKYFNLNVSEEVAIGLPLVSLRVLNRDSNSYLEYLIESDFSFDEQQHQQQQQSTSTISNMFSIVKQTNTRVFLTLDRANLNYKKRSLYNLNIKCIDQDGLYSYAYVQINVVPNLSYSPKFTKDIFSFDLYENVKPGTFIGKVAALSIDEQSEHQQQSVVYKLFLNAETLTAYQMSHVFGENSQNGFNANKKYSDLSDFRLDEQTGKFYF